MPPPARQQRPWGEIAKEAQHHRDATLRGLPSPAPAIPLSLPRSVISVPCEILDASTIQVTSMPLEKLLSLLTTGQISAREVTLAYLQSAACAQGLVNCITELLPELSLGRAKKLDEYYQQHKRPIGPLHGLPISVKEHVGLKGMRCTTGYVSHWDHVSEEDAHILQILQEAGAVFHCRTTVPQTMMHLETDSNLWGVTTNPYNRNLTSGGSSGGEGALIALRGSGLGVGSDVGGSIRSPAANCGIYGIKPTAFRIPTDGWGYMMAGADTVESVLGPLSTSIFGLQLFMKTVIDAEPWLTEPALIPMPWREIKIPQDRPLRIGVLWHDGVVRPHPPITRALRIVTEKLKQSGVEVVDFEPHLHEEAWAIIASLYFTDGGKEDSDAIKASGEPMRPLSEFILGDPCVKKLTVGELTYWLEEREAYRKEYALHWNKSNIDALICPVGPSVAPKHDTSKYWSYTSQWNLLDYPAAVFPVCKVDEKIDKWENTAKFLGGLDKENRKLWDAREFNKVPVSLQLVGRRFEDEKILAILEHLHSLAALPLEPFP